MCGSTCDEPGTRDQGRLLAHQRRKRRLTTKLPPKRQQVVSEPSAEPRQDRGSSQASEKGTARKQRPVARIQTWRILIQGNADLGIE